MGFQSALLRVVSSWILLLWIISIAATLGFAAYDLKIGAEVSGMFFILLTGSSKLIDIRDYLGERYYYRRRLDDIQNNITCTFLFGAAAIILAILKESTRPFGFYFFLSFFGILCAIWCVPLTVHVGIELYRNYKYGE